MEKITKHTEIESVEQGCVLTQITAQVMDMLNLKGFNWTVKEFDLRRGDHFVVRQVETTLEIIQERCYKFGYNGAKRDIVKSKTHKTLSEKTYRLWKTKKRGWYWIEK